MAAACVEFSVGICRSEVTCPCGKTGKNFTYCSSHLAQSTDICQRWALCEACHSEVDHCTKCPPGYTGHTCSRVLGGDILVRHKRQRPSLFGNGCSSIPASCRNPGHVADAKHHNIIECPALRDGRYRAGEMVYFSCNDTLKLKGVKLIFCQTSGEWTEKPTCIPKDTPEGYTKSVTCSNPGPLGNADRYNFFEYPPPLSNGNYRTGELVYFLCKPSFKIKGSSLMFCQASGQWTEKPTCIPENTPIQPYGSYSVQTTATSVQGTKVPNRPGRRPSLFPNGCSSLPASCANPRRVANAKSHNVIECPASPDGRYRAGEMVYYSCNSTLKMKGVKLIFCQTSGKWTEKPTCVPKDTYVVSVANVTCKNPGQLANANRHNFFEYPPPLSDGNYRPGELVYFLCEASFKIKGSSLMFCQGSGEWTEKPTCIPEDAFQTTTLETEVQTTTASAGCGDPGEVAHAKSRPFRAEDYGDMIEFTCDPGFKAMGRRFIICRSSGRWSEKPTCIPDPVKIQTPATPVSCESAGEVAHATSRPTFYRGYASMVEFTCDPGFKMKGHELIFCLISGGWTEKPTCVPDDTPANIEDTTTTVSDLCNLPAEMGPCENFSLKWFFNVSLGACSNFRYGGCEGNANNFAFKEDCEEICAERDYPEPDELMYCDNPGKISNGEVTVTFGEDFGEHSKVAEEFPENTRLEYSCDEGYVLKGTPTINCGTGGVWSDRLPVCDGDCGKSKIWASRRITNGNRTEVGEWPWTVGIAVISGGVPVVQCGGVLIDKKHILTAAHCFDTPGSFVLFFGKYWRKADEDDEEVEKRTNLTVTINPSYNSTTFDSDIALVRFYPDLRFTDRIQPICLPTAESTARNIRLGRKGYVTGWGLNEMDMPSDSLFMAYLPVLPGDHCIKAYISQGMDLPITANMYCAGFEHGVTSACSGDSGSPMVFLDHFKKRFTLEGLISFGITGECTLPQRYTVVTKVLPYLPWVINTKLIS